MGSVNSISVCFGRFLLYLMFKPKHFAGRSITGWRSFIWDLDCTSPFFPACGREISYKSNWGLLQGNLFSADFTVFIFYCGKLTIMCVVQIFSNHTYLEFNVHPILVYPFLSPFGGSFQLLFDGKPSSSFSFCAFDGIP